MADNNKEIEKVSWVVTTRIWWAQTWRWTVMALASGLGMGLLQRALSPQSKLEVEFFKLGTALVIILGGIWATRCSLEARYRSFSIVIKDKSAQEH